ncbi:hypothetical protein F7725_025757 [Dissostichus mawsoni]|uniref:Uncharacterized protein n=1 Tax=Dissostichus mawsoni TaxID=36200 RepID=A0A7J5X561_DISMA|nr:hypothetical protein F7725_025757 [Dissostichus mawsoni]
MSRVSSTHAGVSIDLKGIQQIQCVTERKEQYDTTTDPPGIYRGRLSLPTCKMETTDPKVHQQRSEGPGGQSTQQHQTDLDSIFMLLEDHITFVKNELKKIQTVLTSDYPECLESQREDEECWTVRMKSRGGAERHF